MLYNNPELVSKMSFGKSKTHTKQSISANSLSTSTMESQNFADTLIASMLYNNPELVSKMSFGKSKTHTKQSISANSLSTSTMESQNFADGNSHFNMEQSMTKTETRTKTKSKSISTGINVAPNLDYYLK